MPYVVKDDEFVIIIKPEGYSEEDGSDWAGDVSTAVAMTNDSTIPVEIAAHIMNVATIMTTFLDVAATHPDIYDFVEERRNELMGILEDEDDEEEIVEYEKEGNVLRLTRWTKTEGNA